MVSKNKNDVCKTNVNTTHIWTYRKENIYGEAESYSLAVAKYVGPYRITELRSTAC